MPKGLVNIPNLPSPVPRSPMSPIGVQSPYVPFPRIPYPAGQVPPVQNVTPTPLKP
jgi:hypothetical protein